MSADESVESYFLDLVEDLGERVRDINPDGHDYPVVQLSGLLRSLLLDNLISRANARVCLPIRFRTAFSEGPDWPMNLLPDLRARYAELWPDTLAPAHWTRRAAKLDEFLRLPLLYVRDESFTVKDIVSLAANALGGVHFGDPRDKRLDLLRTANASIRIGEMRPIAGHLIGITDVTVKAVEPLIATLRQAP